MYLVNNITKFVIAIECLIRVERRQVQRLNVATVFTNKLRWAQLNEITLEPRQTDNIKRMITLTDTLFG